MCVGQKELKTLMRPERSDPWGHIHSQEQERRSDGRLAEPVLQSHHLFMRVAITVALLVLLVPVAIEVAKWSWSYVREGWETISLLLRRMR
jgi:hypothetical protein